MDKILITGVSGFIGQALVTALHQEYEIYGAYERRETMYNKNPEIDDRHRIHMNMEDPRNIETMMYAIQPEFIFHLAARSEVANSFENYLEVTRINYGGTVALAEANRKYNPNLKLFVMASTMETYGVIDPMEPVTETTIQRPMAPYAVAKRACELYLDYMQYAYDFPFTVLRQTNAYGRHDNDFFVMERIITQMLAGDTVNLGDPHPRRNFLFIDDLVELYRTLVEKHDLARGETFVTGPDNELSIGSLMGMIAEELEWQGVVNWKTIAPRPGEIFYLNSNPEKAKAILGWEPKVDLKQGIQKTIKMWS